MTAELGGTKWAYTRVREAILSGELAPGQRVSQVQLAERLGIGRPTLREALRMIETEGLISAEHNRQVRVAPLGLADFEELCALRLAVEPLAVRLSVPHLTADELAELKQAEQDMARLHKTIDFSEAAAFHRRFHSLLFIHAGARIRGMADELWFAAERYRRLLAKQNEDLHAVATMADTDHAAIRRAAQARDADECANLIAKHISKISTVTLTVTDAAHDPSLLRTAVSLMFKQSER